MKFLVLSKRDAVINVRIYKKYNYIIIIKKIKKKFGYLKTLERQKNMKMDMIIFALALILYERGR